MKKKILFVNGHLNVGGVEKSLIDILKRFDYIKYDVDLLLFENLGDYYDELPKEVNVIFIDLTRTYGSFIKCIKDSLKQKDWFTLFMKIILTISTKMNPKVLILSKYFFKMNQTYDCAIAFRVGFCAEIVAYCIHAKKKIVWWHHGACQYDHKTKKRMIQTFHIFDTVVSVSKSCQIMIEDYFGNLNNKTIVIPNMIDITSIQQKAEEFNPYLNGEHKWIFVTVGRLSPEKHIDNVVYISNELLKNNFNDFVWYIVGDGIERDKIMQLIKEYDVQNYIRMVGSQTNPYPYMNFADIMIHTSLVESQCITVLEALTLKKPCIVTESLGPQEFIEQYQNGILTTDSSKDIAKTLINVTENKNMIECFKNNSQKVIFERYAIDIIMNKIYLLLEGS